MVIHQTSMKINTVIPSNQKIVRVCFCEPISTDRGTNTIIIPGELLQLTYRYIIITLTRIKLFVRSENRRIIQTVQ